MRKLIIALGLATLTATSVLAAPGEPQTKRGNPDLKKYCTGDALSYCGSIDSDDPAMDACFKNNRDKLSENCLRAVDAYQASGGK